MVSYSKSGVHPAEQGFHIADYVIFTLVLAVSLGIGLYHAFTGGKQKTTGEYLMGNRRLRTIPVALSILVSFVSSILVLGTPAEMYTRGTQLFFRTVGYCFACVVSSLLFVPLFYHLNVTSSFEYLERRYNSRIVKLIGTIMMVIGNCFYMGLVLYTPSTALETVSGLPFWVSIIAVGAVSTVYTSLGGMKAVVWTDVFQSLVIVGGLLAVVIQGTRLVGGLQRVWQLSEDGGRISVFNFSLDPRHRLTFWSTTIGGMFHTLTIFGVGQSSVQRYCALPSLKKAQRSVYLNIPGLLVINILACLTGLVVYAYYADVGCDPLKARYISNSNQLVPYFVLDVLNFPGLTGVFMAVLFSGALSSMSSCLNSVAAVTWEDVLKPHFEALREINKARVLKALVAVYGGIAMVLAFLADRLGGHVLWASISFTGATSGPSLGMFLLGGLFPWANAKGAVCGFFVSSGIMLWIAIGTFITRPYPHYLNTTTAFCNSTPLTEHLLYDAPMLLNGDTYSSAYHTQETTTPAMLELSASTLSPDTDTSTGGVGELYKISFLWYSAIGSSITIIVGLLVSFITGWQKPEEVDPVLIIPFFDRICCCLPARWRRRLHCRVKHVCPTAQSKAECEDECMPSHTPLQDMDGCSPSQQSLHKSASCDSSSRQLTVSPNNNGENGHLCAQTESDDTCKSVQL